MAYRIRYSSSRQSNRPRPPLRVVLSLILLLLYLLGSLCPPKTGEDALLTHPPKTAGEQAVWAASQQLAQGAGLRQALVLWCRSILFSGYGAG